MKYKELVKSIVLVLLFFTSLLLSSQIFFKTNAVSKSESNNNVVWINKKLNIKDYFCPQSYFVNFGGSLHTVLYNSDEKKEITEIISNYFLQIDDLSSIIEIDYAVWQNAIEKKGVGFKLNFEMELDDIISIYKNDDVDFQEDFPVSQISLDINGDIYLRNKDKYYMSKTNIGKCEKLDFLINEIQDSYLEYRSVEKMYSLKKILQGDDDFKLNDELIPIMKIVDIPIIEVVDEVDITDEENMAIKNYATRILGENFIRKVYDYEGSIIYMTGYGEKALKIDNNGYFEYHEKIIENEEELTFLEGFKKSIDALSTINSLPSNIYISNYYKYNASGNEITRYEFNYSYGGYEVLLDNEESSAFIVEYNGSQLISIKRKYKKFISSINVNKIWESALLINVVIDKNYDVIVRNYLRDNKIDVYSETSQYVYEVLQNIKTLEIKYYLKNIDNEEKLVPVWKFEIGNRIYFINIYDGIIVSSINQEVDNGLEKN